MLFLRPKPNFSQFLLTAIPENKAGQCVNSAQPRQTADRPDYFPHWVDNTSCKIHMDAKFTHFQLSEHDDFVLQEIIWL